MKKFTLAPYVRVGFLDGTLHFGFGSLRQLITDKTMQSCILEAAAFLKTPQSKDELSTFLKNLKYSTKTIKAVLDILCENFIIQEGSYNRDDRHSRSLLFYSMSGAEIEKVQNNISNKKVAIVGCGGIGNVVGTLLATGV